MANKDNTNTNKALRDLLKNQASREQAPDDFEKEALEGFALLGGEDEILDAKDKLDKRIYAEVFSKSGGTRKATYWLAAAALLLIVGFAVYLVQNAEVSKPKDLAINENQKTGEGSKMVEPTLSPTGTESLEINKTKAVPVIPSDVSKQTNPKTAAEDLSETTATSEAPPVKTLNFTREEEADKLSAAVVAGNDDEKSLGTGQMKTEEKNQTMAPPTAQRSSQDINAASPSVAENEAGAGDQRQMSEVEVVSVKKSRAKKTKALSQKEESTNCFFKDGEKALHQEIKQKLLKKNLLRKFDAVLFINKVGKVDKVVFTNGAAFAVNEQAEVIELLKTLDKFSFHTPPKNSDLTEYTLKFEP